MAPDEAFEVRLWKEGQADHYGAAEPVRTTSATFNVAGAYGVQLGGGGHHLWTVAVVRINPYQRTGQEAPARVVMVQIGGGGGDNGGGATTRGASLPNTPTPSQTAGVGGVLGFGALLGGWLLSMWLITNDARQNWL